MKLDERNKMIHQLVDAMDDWDLETLLGWAKGQMTSILSDMTLEKLQKEHEMFCDGDETI